MSGGKEYPRSRSGASQSRSRNGARRSVRAYEDVPDQRGALNGFGGSDGRREDSSRRSHERRPENPPRHRDDPPRHRDDSPRQREDSSRRSYERAPVDRQRQADAGDAYDVRERRRSSVKAYDGHDGYNARDNHEGRGRSHSRSGRRFEAAYDDEGLDEENLPWSSWDDLEEQDKRAHPRKGILERLPVIKRIKQPGLRVATAVTLAAVLLCSLASLPIGLVQYSQASALASSGVKHLRTAVTDLTKLGQNPFDKVTIAQAHQELDAGIADFKQLDQTLNQIPSALTVIPGIGPKLAGAKRLIPIAVQGATAGTIVCDALSLLVLRMRNPLDSTSQGISQDDLKTFGGYLDQIQAIFTNVTAQINALTSSDLSIDPRLGPGVAQFREQTPEASTNDARRQDIFGRRPDRAGHRDSINLSRYRHGFYRDTSRRWFHRQLWDHEHLRWAALRTSISPMLICLIVPLRRPGATFQSPPSTASFPLFLPGASATPTWTPTFQHLRRTV